MLAPFGSDGHKDVVKHSVGAAEKAAYRQYDVELHHILGYLSRSSPDTSDSCFALPAAIEDSLQWQQRHEHWGFTAHRLRTAARVLACTAALDNARMDGNS